jgi:hypothetical protein
MTAWHLASVLFKISTRPVRNPARGALLCSLVVFLSEPPQPTPQRNISSIIGRRSINSNSRVIAVRVGALFSIYSSNNNSS